MNAPWSAEHFRQAVALKPCEACGRHMPMSDAHKRCQRCRNGGGYALLAKRPERVRRKRRA